MVQRLDHLKETPSQTAGPYIHIGATPNHSGIAGVYSNDLGKAMVGRGAKGERITIVGRVFDGAGEPLKDALVEIWQADAAGLHNSPQEKRGKADPNFTGFGRQATDGKTGEFRFETIKPGAVPFVDGRLMAPHITAWIIARGINVGLHTRMYFSDEAAANAKCPVLARLEHQGRVKSLIAERSEKGGKVVYRFDIRLQGEDQTVFFDI
ncbi:MAG TPA: protocatechuate 3,4-dioxygenase subunit alpha [Roseiarcus sp.]|nr:protocatechuate 3,4-dioxygenase subunit alpha [Roseiarcus sp.]